MIGESCVRCGVSRVPLGLVAVPPGLATVRNLLAPICADCAPVPGWCLGVRPTEEGYAYPDMGWVTGSLTSWHGAQAALAVKKFRLAARFWALELQCDGWVEDYFEGDVPIGPGYAPETATEHLCRIRYSYLRGTRAAIFVGGCSPLSRDEALVAAWLWSNPGVLDTRDIDCTGRMAWSA